MADGHALEPGTNALDITATTHDGDTVTRTQTVTHSGADPLSFTVEALTSSPPFIARITLSLVPQLVEVVGGGIGTDIGFLVIKRNEGAQTLYFTVYCEQGEDGVWRIS